MQSPRVIANCKILKTVAMCRKILAMSIIVACVCLAGEPACAYESVDLRAQEASILDQLNKARSPEDKARALGLSPDYSLELVRSKIDRLGWVNRRYRLLFRGVPVWGAQLTSFSWAGDGRVQRLRGTLVKGLESDVREVKPTVGMAEVLAVAKLEHEQRQESGHGWQYSREGVELVIYPGLEKASLAYFVSFFADASSAEATEPHALIDAQTGETLIRWDGLPRADVGEGPGGNQLTGMYEYGVDRGFLDVDVDGNICTMDVARPEGGGTFAVNLGNTDSLSGPPFSFDCFRNTFQAINGAFSPINDAYFHLQVFYDMFAAWYTPLPGRWGTKVHYKVNHLGAFWAGNGAVFGDGNPNGVGVAKTHPFTSLDIVAHEMAHGVSIFNAGPLGGPTQAGGINESFSDISGEVAEFFFSGTNDFLVGADITIAEPALRYMHDPPLDGASIDHVDDFVPGMDPHQSSGIYNKAFYRLATTPGWDTRKAYDVFLRALENYWVSNTSFTAGADGVLDAASDLGYDAADVASAFSVVGIDLPVAADLAVSLSQAAGGSPGAIQLTATVSNLGPQAGEAFLEIFFAPNLGLQIAALDPACQAVPAPALKTAFVCDLDVLAFPNGATSVRWEVESTNPSGGSIDVTATADGSINDPVKKNNSAATTIAF